MKRKIAVLSAILLMLSLGVTVYASDTISDSEMQAGRYSYEVTVSDDVWSEMTYPEKVEMYSIPQDVLDKMTTQQLVQAVMDYPYLIDLTLFNSFEEGYAHVLKCSDALRELEKREDGFIELAKYYENMPVPLTEIEGDTSVIKLFYAEILISNMAGEATVSENQLDQFVEIIDKKNAQKDLASDIYSTEFGVAVSGVQPYRIEFTSHIVKTLKGVNISVIHYLTDFSVTEKNQQNIEFQNNYPNATVFGTATRMYNCASYAMINRSTSNEYWLNQLPPDYSGYTKLGSAESNAKVGGVVYYANSQGTNGSHVGVVYNISGGKITIRSKMGFGPLAQHELKDCPYYDSVNTTLIFYN